MNAKVKQGHSAPVFVRDMTTGDAAAVLQVHYNAVHHGTGDHYNAEIKDRWSPPLHEDSVSDFLFNPDNEIRFVAMCEETIAGFGCLVLAENELRACYVDPDYLRKGVGTALVQAIEGRARSAGLPELNVTSSLNAEAFYRRNGYKVVRQGTHTIRGGVEMPCVYMNKKL